MASLSDILTTAQNIVKAINNVAQTYLEVQGIQSLSNVSTTTLVKSTSGRVATIAVTTAGSTVGNIYDSNTASSTNNKIYVIPNTVGLYVVNIPVNYGIVVVPGTSQVIALSFS